MPKIKTELSESEIISINAELNKQNLLLNEIKESHFRKIDTTKNTGSPGYCRHSIMVSTPAAQSLRKVDCCCTAQGERHQMSAASCQISSNPWFATSQGKMAEC